MKASEVAAVMQGSRMSGPDREFYHLRANSLMTGEGDAFIALKGSVTDGHRFIPDALMNGASLIICNSGSCAGIQGDVTFIEAPDTREGLARLLPVLYPDARRLKLIGITGTNGKTTITYLMESILKTAGINPGVIGTINIRYNGISTESENTTPGPIELFEQLDVMGRGKVKACVMEVSSHSLDQERIMGLVYDCAVFTNLSQDHLDYHKDMETYFLAKKKLFTKTHLSGKAVINADDAYGKRLMAENPEALTYGRDSDAAIRLRSLRSVPGGMIIVLSTPQEEILIRTHLLGDINGYNIMAAAGAAMALGIDRETIINGIEELEGVPGRMEPVRNSQGLNIIVDYAHTPDALNHALTSARAMTKGRLITVFGCGGDRDRAKRPLMGAIAAGISDLVIVTSDNPRSEDPQAIIDEILKGIPDMTYVSVEPDRKEAIRLGIHSVMEDDCLIIAGKGHENYQLIGKEKTHFDDRECVLKCLREIYGT